MLNQDPQGNWSRVLAKAWADPYFKEALKASPKEALATMGINSAKDLEIIVVEDTPSTMYLTLPAAPSIEGVLDDELDVTMSGSACLPCKGGTTGCQTVDWGCK